MAGELYRVVDTGVTWTNTGGDEVLDLGGLAAGAVRVGAYHDWGAGAKPDEYMGVLKLDGWDTAPVIGETVDVYISESQDGTIFSGPETPSDAADEAGDTDRLKNLLGPFSAAVHSTTATDDVVIVFYYQSAARFHAPVVHNNTADALLSTGDAHILTIYPNYYQSQ